MEKIYIKGGNKLYGDVYVDGMKNAALPIIFACILVKDKCVIENIPQVSDVIVSLEILRTMGAEVKFLNPSKIEIDATNINYDRTPFDLCGKIRASTYLLGAELSRFGSGKITHPGGCDFSERPIDQHIKGFEALGATCSVTGGYITLSTEEKIRGTSIYCDISSVGATCNIMLAATYAEGTTIIDNAAREPHIVDLANFLNSCGADIFGAGTSTIRIRGVKALHGCEYKIIPDMIEAGTFMAAVAATGGRLTIHNVIPKHVESITAKLTEMGVHTEVGGNVISVVSTGKINRASIRTLPYPGFPTDMQPQFAVLLAKAEGHSTIYESIWNNRYRYLSELKKMGVDYTIEGKTATFFGNNVLKGAPVTSVDLRAGAALIIAGLIAEGETEIDGLNKLDRGYFDIVGKLRAVGADISRKTIREEVSEQIAR